MGKFLIKAGFLNFKISQAFKTILRAIKAA